MSESESNDEYYRDQYDRKINPNLMYEYEERDNIDYSNEKLIFSKEMYEDELISYYNKYMKNAQMSPNVKAILWTFFGRQTSKDIVLGNYTPRQAKVDYFTLKIDMNVARMNLKGEDALQRLSGSWDMVATFICAVMKQKLNRAIHGFERRMQNETKTVEVHEQYNFDNDDRDRRKR